MARNATWKSQSDEVAGSLFLCLIVLVAGAAGLFFLLHVLLKPTVRANPGMAAYEPPPLTRLLPLPRKSDAPELAELPAEPPSPLTAFAQTPADERKEAKGDEVRPAARKRPRVDPREYDARVFGYSPQWNDGYRGGWNNYRAGNGGSRSWF